MKTMLMAALRQLAVVALALVGSSVAIGTAIAPVIYAAPLA